MASPTSVSLSISWGAAEGATSYQLYRDVAASGNFASKVYTGTTTSHVDTTLDGGTSYYYKVKAVNAAGASAFSDPASGTTYTAYIAGELDNSPCYWKGSTKNSLPGGLRNAGAALSIVVQDGTVYTAGGESDRASGGGACYWVGTTRNNLYAPAPFANWPTVAKAIALDPSGNVYVCGTYRFSDSNNSTWNRACYWTGGAAKPLGTGSTCHTYVNAIFIDQGNIYTGGSTVVPAGTRFPAYWAGSTYKQLSAAATKNYDVMGIANVDGVFYAVGQTNLGDAASCRNGVWTPLPGLNGSTLAWATCMVVAGGVVYTGGFYQDGNGVWHPCYWNGMQLVSLGTEGGYVYGISVRNGIVYAAGSYSGTNGNMIACYWAGGVKVVLSDDTHDSNAYGICIQ